MNRLEVKKLRLGVYLLEWKDGSESVASVGCLHDGTAWFAPSNWTAKVDEREHVVCTDWRLVKKATLLAFVEPTKEEEKNDNTN